MRWKVLILLLILFITIQSVSATHANSTYISEFLRNASGNHSVVGDFAANSEFLVRPPHNETWEIGRLLVMIRDAGITNLDNYGGIGSTLTNGVRVYLDQNGTLIPLDANVPILTNGDWGRNNYDITVNNLAAGDDYLYVRWSFFKSVGDSEGVLTLNGDENDRLLIMVNDDFTGLVDHTFLVQGKKVDDEVEGLDMVAIALFLIAAYAFLFVLVNKLKTQTPFWEWAKNILMIFCLFMSIAGVYTGYVFLTGDSTDVANAVLISYVPYIFVAVFLFIMMMILFTGDVMTKMLNYAKTRKFLKKRYK